MAENTTQSWWPKRFRYSLTYNGVTTVLKYEPDTWSDFSLKWQMDKLFWTRALSLGIPTKFVKDGKEIIDLAYREQGIGAKVMFRIEMFDYDTAVWAYQTIYYNQLNFASLISERDYVELESEPQGLMQLLAKKGDQEFEIDMSDGAVVNYDRIKFNQFAKYHVVNDAITSSGTFTPTIIIDEESIVTVRKTKAIEFQSTALMYSSESSIISSGLYFMKCNREISIKISMDIGVNIYFSQSSAFAKPTMSVTIKILDKDKKEISKAADSGVWSSGDYGGVTMYSVSARLLLDNTTLNLTAGNEYYIIVYFNFSGVENPNFTSSISGGVLYPNIAKWDYRGQSKSINTISPLQLAQRLLSKITEGHDGAYSVVSMNPFQNDMIGITCGDAIRGNSDAKIKTTFNDFFKTFSRIFSTGLDIRLKDDGSEEVRLFMPISSFFESDESAAVDLGEVTELRVKPWLDKIPSEIAVGYNDNSYENSDGKGEFNTELQFSTPVNSKTNKLDLIVPYRADSYGVEYVLIDFEKDDTSDSKADNDVFLIVRNGNAVARDTEISGTYADSTMFNGYISPKSIVYFNAGLLSSMLYRIPLVSEKNIIFGSSKKDMDVVIGGRHERESELFIDGYFFKPTIIEFYTGIKNFNAYEILRENPNRIFKFSFMGKTYKGYLLELNVQPAINQKQDWQVICHAGTNI